MKNEDVEAEPETVEQRLTRELTDAHVKVNTFSIQITDLEDQLGVANHRHMAYATKIDSLEEDKANLENKIKHLDKDCELFKTLLFKLTKDL